MPLGIGGELLRHVGTDVLADAAVPYDQRKEKQKWGAVFGVFALSSLLISWLRKESLKDADLLGGKATVERFMHTNVTALLVATVLAVAFIIVVFRTWKGRQSSIYQLVFTVGSAVIVGFSMFTAASAVSKINQELKNPRSVTVEKYVLCKRGSDCILAFDEQGTSDSILLVIPAEKYEELSGGEASTKGYTSRTWRLIEDSEYVTYTDATLYETPIDVTYFGSSIIYDSAGFAE